MGNNIVRPITDDGLVGYDQYGQLVLEKNERSRTVITFVADVRNKSCAICNHGWQPTAASMDDQQFWSLLDGHVHATCLVRHFGLIDRADFYAAICDARLRFRGLVAIPNEYWPDAYREKARPWFKAELIDHAASLVIGSRKRVIELRVVAEGPCGFDWADQAEKEFAGEDVTKNFSEREVRLHAWSTAKLRDYIRKIAKVSGFEKDLERERENARNNVLGNSGASAEPGASRPAAAPADQPAALAPDELCDIDDLPDCLIGGVHQPHCRHAGKPVTKGGNP